VSGAGSPQNRSGGRPSGAVPPERARVLKTYSHLSHQKRVPTRYELVTTNLLYKIGRGLEVDVPLKRWYEQHQAESPLRSSDWEAFADPRRTTYSSYTALQSRREIFVDGILQAIDDQRVDEALPKPWIEALERVIAPSRYLFHGLQMLAAYIGQMAPSGRVLVAALFQTADEVRRTQRFAYRMRQLQIHHPGFGERSREAWQTDPLWQPAREAVERMLVTFDFGEALVALNLSFKPMMDELLMNKLGELAVKSGDPLLRALLSSLYEDSAWQRDWTAELFTMLLRERAENRAVITGWLEKWHPFTRRAAAAFAPIWGELFAGIERDLDEFFEGWLRRIDLAAPGSGAPR